MIDVRKFTDGLNGKPVAVFGLGVSNLAAIRALRAAGAEVWAWDDKAESHAAARQAGADIHDFTKGGMESCACLVLAPGVPLDVPEPHAAVMRAREAGIEILCDIEILHRAGHGRKVVGITGTNGKSTTTALTGHILNGCGVKAAVGGNIGRACLDLDLPPPDGVFVLELSSFQLDLCPSFAPDIAVMLNITPDHLDRHGSMEAYIAAKARIFRGRGKAVIGIDDTESRLVYETVMKREEQRQLCPISAAAEIPADGVYARDGDLYDGIGHPPEKISGLSSIPSLPGVHNHQNAAAAYAVARLLGLAPDRIFEAMKTFPGLPHRQQTVRVIQGVPYINDSKATNADAAARALACYRNICWILGGKPKEGGLAGLEPFMDRVSHAFLIGQAAQDFGSWLDKRGVPHNFSGTLDRAVEEAHRLAQAARGRPGGAATVLFSPACASFDQFRNFEHRGEVFTDLVNHLQEEPA